MTSSGELKNISTREMVVKSALHYHVNEMPCNWDLNIYRGCTHGCRYCFAQYSHDYLGVGNFFSEIFAKVNVAEVLDRELRRKSWKHARINLSGVTDAYQPAEADQKIMPGVWEILIRHRNPVVITTKSALILRDIDLIGKLASVTSVYVGASITMLDDRIQKIIEPGAATAAQRFEVLERCRKAGCVTNVMLTPVLPYLNDSKENLEGICSLAGNAKVAGLSAWPLNLRGNTKQKFFRFLEAAFPELLPAYRKLYQRSEIDRDYWKKISRLKDSLRQKYNLPGIQVPPAIPRTSAEQLSLF